MLILHNIPPKEDSPKTIHNKNSRRNKIVFDKEKYLETGLFWRVSRIRTQISDGFYITMPAEKLTDRITNDLVLDFLNNNSDLVKKFSLKEHDYFYLRFDYLLPEIRQHYRPGLYTHLLFQFISGKWQKGSNDGYNLQDTIAEGTAEFIGL